MKKLFAVFVIALALSACGQANNTEITETTDTVKQSEEMTETTTSQETTTTQATTETTAETEPKPTAIGETTDNGSNKYLEAEEKISNFMGRFISLGTGNYDDIQSCIITEETDAMGQSAEGGGVVRYMTDEGENLRYSVTFYGETGRREHNYYIIDEGCAYYTSLTMDYYCRDWQQEQYGDILKYSLEEYWLDNDEYYLIDRINSTLVPCEKNPAEHLEKYF